jgi:hypothetical protein
VTTPSSLRRDPRTPLAVHRHGTGVRRGRRLDPVGRQRLTPLATPMQEARDGRAIGTLLAMDSRPRRWTAPQLDLLGRLSALIVSEMEADKGLRTALHGARLSQPAARLRGRLEQDWQGFPASTNTWELSMSTRFQPLRLYRTAMILGAVLYAAATPLASQQVVDSARVAQPASAGGSATTATAPATTTTEGPRATPRFQSFAPSLERGNLSAAPSPMREGRSHTIVISTLALVLIVIIVVLLVR